jgi:hypothetical protein
MRTVPEKRRSRPAFVALVLSRALAAALPLGVVAVPATAHADPEDATRDDAKRLFQQGSADLLAKRYPEALESLRASYKLVPSPNSGLLIARCLRELNRRVEAVEMYGTVAADARRRAEGGDAKYGQTADVAAAEGGALRATLGLVRVRVSRPAPGSTLEIDGVARPVTDADVVVLHLPGEVTVTFTPAAGPPQSQRATLAAGADLRMEFTAAPSGGSASGPPPPPARTTPAPDADGSPPSWTVPAALISGALTLAGTGVFIGFGLKSRSIYDDLNARCGPASCGDAERATADSGKQNQTIANVGLAVGIVSAAATFAFLLVRAAGPRSTTAGR